MIVRFSRRGAGDNSPYTQEPCEVESLMHGSVVAVGWETTPPTTPSPRPDFSWHDAILLGIGCRCPRLCPTRDMRAPASDRSQCFAGLAKLHPGAIPPLPRELLSFWLLRRTVGFDVLSRS